MGLLKRKSAWQRVTDPVTSNVDVKSAGKSGLAAFAGVVSLTVASAVVSSLRKRETK